MPPIRPSSGRDRTSAMHPRVAWALLLGASLSQEIDAAKRRRFEPRVSGECGQDRGCNAEEVFHSYLDWHNHTLSSYPCERNRVSPTAAGSPAVRS